jgi:hypothetical protein
MKLSILLRNLYLINHTMNVALIMKDEGVSKKNSNQSIRSDQIALKPVVKISSSPLTDNYMGQNLCMGNINFARLRSCTDSPKLRFSRNEKCRILFCSNSIKNNKNLNFIERFKMYQIGEHEVESYFDISVMIKRFEYLDLLKSSLFTDSQTRLIEVVRKIRSREYLELNNEVESDIKLLYGKENKSVVDENLFYLFKNLMQ